MKTTFTPPHAAGLYKIAAETYDSLPAFASRKRATEWTPFSFRELYDEGLKLATGLIELGVKARDHVGLFGDNRLEWMIADYGVQLSGAANVPRGRDITDGEMEYIINHAGIRLVFVETEALQDQILRLRPKIPGLKHIVLLDPDARNADEVLPLKEVISRGKLLRSEGNREAEKRIDNIQSDDLFTLIYTSGTTGTPKGVMLTHANAMAQLQAIPLRLSCTDRVLSILPIWHILERMIELYTIYCGACTYYTSVRTLKDDLINVEPTFMGSAPRLWENLYKQIMNGVRTSHPVRRLLFHTAYFLGQQYHDSLLYIRGNHLQLKPVSWYSRMLIYLLNSLRLVLVLPWYAFFNVTVLESIRQVIGSSLKATVSGGGALQADIDRFFNYIGVSMLEGYGLTETAPVVSVRTMKKPIIGTVGPPVPNTEIRITDPESGDILYPDQNHPGMGRGKQGEICVKGPQVMKGYYKQADLTRKVLKDGWLRTGDLGMVTYNDCLKIMGRMKSTIVLSNGENVEPEPIEMKLMQSPYIDVCMVVGQDQKHLAALIVLNEEEARLNSTSQSFDQLCKDPDIHSLISGEIKTRVNSSSDFKSYENISDFRILPCSFEVGEELTNLFKVKRHVVEKKYNVYISELFNGNHL